MKQYITAPLCSALVVPGLGQILNRNMKKGLIIMAAVFLLIIALTFDLALIVSSLLSRADITQLSFHDILGMIGEGNDSSLFCLIALFALLWIYAVLDALWVGIKLERRKGIEAR